jgi:hypothetical protein
VRRLLVTAIERLDRVSLKRAISAAKPGSP